MGAPHVSDAMRAAAAAKQLGEYRRSFRKSKMPVWLAWFFLGLIGLVALYLTAAVVYALIVWALPDYFGWFLLAWLISLALTALLYRGLQASLAESRRKVHFFEGGIVEENSKGEAEVAFCWSEVANITRTSGRNEFNRERYYSYAITITSGKVVRYGYGWANSRDLDAVIWKIFGYR